MGSELLTKPEDTLNRFYTRTAVGDLLVDQLADLRPSNVLDLGTGDGSLSKAVVRHWNGINVVTVDLDPTIVAGLHTNLINLGALSHRHHLQDVFDPSLNTILKQHGSFDLAVCNPPFFRPTWSKDFAKILQLGNLVNACPSIADVTAEILFLAQNLHMLKSGGKVALIAPDGMITGCRSMPFRRAIMDDHAIDCVMQLPHHSFHDTEARCFILIITKNGAPVEKVKLTRYDPTTGLSAPIFINRIDALQRMDFDFHVSQKTHKNGMMTLRELGADIKRGSLNTIQRKESEFNTFHTTDYSNLADGRIAFKSTAKLPINGKMIIAEPGDILMARVDRSLHNKIGIVISGSAALTDCVYRVRLPTQVRELSFNALRSPAGMASLLSASKGVSARLLGKADLLDLPLKIEKS